MNTFLWITAISVAWQICAVFKTGICAISLQLFPAWRG